MKIAYFDCIAGASGDMILGALLDAGLPEADLRLRLEELHLDEFELTCRKMAKNGFSATRVEVVVADRVHERRLHDIEAVITGSSLPEAIQVKALSIFRRLVEVEAGIHNRTVDEVHLHELGGVDTIVDVVGTLAGLEALSIERVVVSPLPLGRGFIRGAHGQIPLPAPATVALLRGAPVVGSEIDKELVTPTGAVLLTSLAESYGPIPAMTLTGVGYGAGGWDLPIPNVIRVLLGEASSALVPPFGVEVETLVMLETNVDDLNPEIFGYVMERLFQMGALDVFLSDIHMKKNRPATMIHVLGRPENVAALNGVLFNETSTLGVRQQVVTRQALPREIQTVGTPYGPVRIKIAWWGPGQAKTSPEYEDCRQLAEQKQIPLLEVYRAAARSAEDWLAAQNRLDSQSHPG